MAEFMSEISSLKDAVLSSTVRTVTSDPVVSHAQVNATWRQSIRVFHRVDVGEGVAMQA